LKNALVTGAAGFIGSHLVEKLIAKGYAVTAFLHYNSQQSIGNLRFLDRRILKDVKIVFGDITDSFSVRSVVRQQDVVFHLAALIGIPYSYVAPLSYIQTNIIGTHNVLQACLSCSVAHLVHTSTSEVYGSAQYLPINENHPLVGQSPYSASKISADKLVESFARSFGLSQTTIRPFNTFGPRQSNRAVIPTIVSQVMQSKSIRLGNLHAERDYTYVSDTVEAFLLADKIRPKIDGAINLGFGKCISVENLVNKIKILTGVDLSIQTENKRIRPQNSEVDCLLSDNALAKRVLGWEPTVSLDNGLMKCIGFATSELNGIVNSDDYTI